MAERGSRKIPVTERQFLWVQDDDKGEVADPQGAKSFADEIGVAGAVNDVEFLAEPVAVHQGGRDGDLAVLFLFVIIRNRGSGADAPHAIDDARAGEHGLTE